MKRNFILGSVVAAAMTVNAYALDIQGGKLLGHKEWATGKVTGFVKQGTDTAAANKIKLLKLMKERLKPSNGQDGRDFVYAADYLSSINTTINSLTTVPAATVIQIENNTSATQNYTMQSGLCLYSMPSDGGWFEEVGCKFSSNNVQLNKDGRFQILEEYELSHVFLDTNSAFAVMFTTVDDGKTTYLTQQIQDINFDSK